MMFSVYSSITETLLGETAYKGEYIYIYMNEHVKAVVLHLTSLTTVVYC